MAMVADEKGLEYYPLHVDYFRDPKIVKFCLKFGDEAELVYIHALNIIYHHNYYVEADADGFATMLYLSFNKRTIELDSIREMVLFMAEVGLIDKKSLDEGIVTSKGVQKQFYASTIRRKEKEHVHWILDDEDEARVDVKLVGKFAKNELSEASVNSVHTESDLNSKNVIKNKQSKSKSKRESKSNSKSRRDRLDKDDQFDNGRFPGPLNYYTSCLIESKILSEYEPEEIDKFNELFEGVQRAYSDNELVNRCFRYTRDYVKRNKDTIGDLFAFFHTAFTSNLEKMEGYDERMQDFFKG